MKEYYGEGVSDRIVKPQRDDKGVLVNQNMRVRICLVMIVKLLHIVKVRVIALKAFLTMFIIRFTEQNPIH